jgi:hypothetical protein
MLEREGFEREIGELRLDRLLSPTAFPAEGETTQRGTPAAGTPCVADEQLLDTLKQRFAAGEIWNEDHLALEILFVCRPKLRPRRLPKLWQLNSAAIKHQRELTPIREGIVRPLFGNLANFSIPPVGECQIIDLKAVVAGIGPIPGNKAKTFFKRDEGRSPRPRGRVDAIVLHHMAYNIGNDVNSYQKVGSHFIVTADGKIAQLYDELDFLNASNTFNPRSIAIEFAGNFPTINYHWWSGKGRTIPDRCYVTPAQARAGRCLLQTLKQRFPGIQHLFAHRQSSLSRENDPGPDIWFNVGEWAISNLNLDAADPQHVERSRSTRANLGRAIDPSWQRARPSVAGSVPVGQPPASPAPTASGSGVGGIGGAISRGIDVAMATAALSLALLRGERDENRLTDLIFQRHHPELGGGRIPAGNRQLVQEWLQIRDQIVRPYLRSQPSRPASSAPQAAPTSAPNRLGTLSVAAWREAGVTRPHPAFTYRFTQEDALWLARLLVGEAGGGIDADNAAVVWALVNRYALFYRRAYNVDFHVFIRRYSTVLQPVLKSWGAAKRHYLSAEFKKTGGNYGHKGHPEIPQGQLQRYLDLQARPWDRIPEAARSMAVAAMTGAIASPIGLASEFASTRIYFRQAHGGREPTEQEWRTFTESHARKKNWVWIGDRPKLDQRKNAFFLDRRAASLPATTVRIAPP